MIWLSLDIKKKVIVINLKDSYAIKCNLVMCILLQSLLNTSCFKF